MIRGIGELPGAMALVMLMFSDGKDCENVESV
jgi:hypothetical protein